MEKSLDAFTRGRKGGKRGRGEGREREGGVGSARKKEKGTIITKDSSPLSALIAPYWR